MHSSFVNQVITEVKKGKRFILFPRPHIVDNDKTIHVFGTCAACGEPLEAAYVVGSFILECQHLYHPLCFSSLLHTSGACVKEGCGMEIPPEAKAWINGGRYSVKSKFALFSIMLMFCKDFDVDFL